VRFSAAALRRGLPLLATGLAAIALAGCGGDDDESTQTTPRPIVSQVSQVPRLGNAPGTTAPKGPEELNKLPPARRPRGRLAPRINGVEGVPLPQALDTVGNDVASFWLQQFNASGLRFEPAKQAIIITTGETTCAPDRKPLTVERGPRGEPAGGPFYCSLDKTIFLPVGDFEDWIAPVGDASTAVVVAHEWGHHVEWVLGMFRDPRYQDGPWLELTADCLAGVWMASVFQRGALEENDVREALTLMSKVGDNPGRPTEDPHGTADQRMAAFNQGFGEGRAGDCTTLHA
jgi:predicted metalloprotease